MSMKNDTFLDTLLNCSVETEIKEFKEAKDNYDFKTLGKYFSALSNEARLKNVVCAWLIFGVQDKTGGIVGSAYRKEDLNFNKLKKEVADKVTDRLTFQDVYVKQYLGKRVVFFQIPAAPKGIPVAFEGHYYGRDGESLGPLNLTDMQKIQQATISDWSAEILVDATLEDLDSEAIDKARENYKKKFPNVALDVDQWTNVTFLNKTKVIRKGKITRTAIILLGKSESVHFLSPAQVRIRWILKSESNLEKDYELFSIPFLLSVDHVYSKIRNLKYRYIKDGTLFPEEIQRYEPFVIREAINNCIAHQDYEKGGMINVVEIGDEKLVFSNYGGFIPQSVEKVIMDDSPEEFYRNRFLVEAMFNLNMVDTIGSGIKKMFSFQKERLFPLPDYNFKDGKVTVTITGKVLNADFARVLSRHPDLSLDHVMVLDKIQKHFVVSEEDAKPLKELGLIEGRKPNYYISSRVVEETRNPTLKAQYIRHRGFDDEYYKKLVVNFVKKFGSATRKDIDALIVSKLPDVLHKDQKKIKINNLLGALRRSGVVVNLGTTNKPKYVCKND